MQGKNTHLFWTNHSFNEVFGYNQRLNPLIHRRHAAHVVDLHRDAVAFLLGRESGGHIDVAETAKGRIVGGEKDAVVARLPYGKLVVGDGMWAPIEDENQVATLVDDGLVRLVGQQKPSGQGLHHDMAFHQVEHGTVESAHEAVFQVLVVDERPLATGELVAPIVACTRKVNPFGMAELVAHEVEPSLA